MNVRCLFLLVAFTLLTFSKTKAQFFFESSIGSSIQTNQFRGPDDVAVDATGNIYIVDGVSNQIKKLDASGAPLLQWGAGGNNNGQFNNPISVTTDASGNVYVMDFFRCYIQKFDSNGAFITKWGSGTFASGDGQFAWPAGIALDASGNMYVADTHNHRIQKFNSAGTFITKWGTRGSGDGQFEYPQAIAVDASGNVYVVDTNNHRVQKFNSSGTFLSKWGSNGQGDGQFNYPLGIAVDVSGNVYVSDTYNNRIQKFNILGNFVAKLGSYGSANGQFSAPRGVDIDAAGNLYVSDRSNKRIQKFNSSFTFLNAFGISSSDGQLNDPWGVARDASGNIYVVDKDNYQIQKFNSTGTFVTRWGSLGSGNGQFSNLFGVAVDAINNVYVLDGGNNRVQKFNSSGTYITQWGSSGSGNSQFTDPHGIAIDGSNNVYVVDKNNHRIQKFNSSGTFITKWGSLGIANGDLNFPECIAVDASGDVYVTDTQNSRVQKFSSTGTYITKWGSTGSANGQFESPFGISVSANGNVYVTDGNNRIQKFTNTGTHLASFGTYGWANGTLRHPRGVVADAAGNVYITDSNHRIQKFSVLDIISLSTASGLVGSSLTISGSGFSSVSSENVVRINGAACAVTSTSTSSLTVTVPVGATTGKVSVTRAGFTTQSASEFLVLPLVINSFTPDIGSAGAFVTITGTGFSSVPTNNTVKFNGIAATATSSTATSIIASVPAGNTVGKITVTVNGVTATSAANFNGELTFGSFNPTNAIAGTSVTITGTGFSLTPSDQLVEFNGALATITSSSLTSLTVTVPAGATTGKVTVKRAGYTVSSATEFLALPLTITSFTPGISMVGTPITINGTGFSSVSANNSVSFNGSPAAVISSTATTINLLIPLGSTTGKISVTVKGVTATSATDFIITTLAITQVVYPTYFNEGDTEALVNISVNNVNEVDGIKINRRGITEDESDRITNSIAFTNSTSISVSLPASYFNDPLGLSLWFTLTDKSGNELPSASGNIHMRYPAPSSSQFIPDLKSGQSAKAYQLIAIPLELSDKNMKNVFADLGAYNTKKWRLFQFDGTSIAERPASINTGKGYWFIMANKNEINPGAGNVVRATKEAPYKMNLQQGWNLIGNPYNFSISWNDVLDHNGLPTEKLKFRQFLNGAFVDEPLLKRFRGGFVESDISREIEIPVINKSPNGGRIASQTHLNPLDAPAWQVNLSLHDGEFSNSLLGFGMNPQAAEGKDLWDETTLPMLQGLSSSTLTFGEVQGNTLAKSVVPFQNNYSWTAELLNTSDVTLTWNNAYFGDNNKVLVLELSDRVELTNMRSAVETTIPKGKHTLKFHFGSSTYIKDQVSDNTTRVGSVYPNPINRKETHLTIQVSLPEGQNEVSLALQSMHGEPTELSGSGVYIGGRQSIQWDVDFSKVPAGLYLIKIKNHDANGASKVVYRKVIIE